MVEKDVSSVPSHMKGSIQCTQPHERMYPVYPATWKDVSSVPSHMKVVTVGNAYGVIQRSIIPPYIYQTCIVSIYNQEAGEPRRD